MMTATFLAHFLILLLMSTIYDAIQVGDLDVNIGIERGISSSSSSVSPETLSRIMEGVEKGNADNIYFYGLLKMYGISMIKDVKGAAHEFRRAADKNHKEATTALGVMLLSGAAGEKDDIEALSFLRKGVSLGDQNAQWLLAMMYMEGRGVEGNRPRFEEAAALLTQAADKHVPQALYQLAVLHEYGKGVRQDMNRAASLYRQASELHDSIGSSAGLESLYHLALMTAQGRGVSQSFETARSLLERAAAMDHAPSIYFIGVFKTHGHGCEVQYEQALRWFERAAALDDYRVSDKARKAAEELRSLLDQARDGQQAVYDSLHARNQVSGEG